MSLEDDFKRIFEVGEEITPEQILNSLLNKEDIEVKTEIPNPLNLSRLKVLETYLRNRKMKVSAELINDFIYFFLVYMVSYRRKGREEVVRVLSKRLEEKEEEIKERLLGVK